MNADFLVPTQRSDEAALIADAIEGINDEFPVADDLPDPRRLWDRLVELGVHHVLLETADPDVGVLDAIAGTLGAGLNADPFIWGAVVVPSILGCVDPGAAVDALRAHLAAGRLFTIAIHRSSGDLDEMGDGVRVRPVGGRWRANGQVRYVPLPQQADGVLLLATGAEGQVLVQLSDPASVQWTDRTPFDLRTPLADVALDEVEVHLVGRMVRPVAPALTLPLFCQAAAISGSAQRALRDAVGYSRVREQFGVPIASFQAIRHRLAEALVEVELMRAALWRAGRANDGWAMLLAAFHCMSVAAAVARSNIQVHGGIGYTWEHEAHRHYRYAFAAAQAICSTDSLERHLVNRLMAGREANRR